MKLFMNSDILAGLEGLFKRIKISRFFLLMFSMRSVAERCAIVLSNPTTPPLSSLPTSSWHLKLLDKIKGLSDQRLPGTLGSNCKNLQLSKRFVYSALPWQYKIRDLKIRGGCRRPQKELCTQVTATEFEKRRKLCAVCAYVWCVHLCMGGGGSNKLFMPVSIATRYKHWQQNSVTTVAKLLHWSKSSCVQASL